MNPFLPFPAGTGNIKTPEHPRGGDPPHRQETGRGVREIGAGVEKVVWCGNVSVVRWKNVSFGSKFGGGIVKMVLSETIIGWTVEKWFFRMVVDVTPRDRPTGESKYET